MSRDRIPMTVIGGFLGAGKTTLLNRILTEAHGIRYGVLVNDFGSIAVDDSLVKSHDGTTISFANGCVCCSLGDNLVGTIDRLVENDNPPSQFLVEASGVANPRAIADLATLHPNLKRDITIVLADAETIKDRLRDERLVDTIEMQLGSADLLVLNKCDLVPDPVEVIELLAQYEHAEVIQAVNANIPLTFLEAGVLNKKPPGLVDRESLHHHPEQTFVSETLYLREPVGENTLRGILKSKGLLRAKGFVRLIDQPELVHVENVAGRTSFEHWPHKNPFHQDSSIVVIGLRGVLNTEQMRALLE